jgi:predicted dehydrogenase
VCVATPHAGHRAAAGLCPEAGKAVLREKAFAPNAAEAGGPVAAAG